jgi:alanine dehydrogenase
MKGKIGIRHEDKYALERRAALTPAHVKQLSEKYGLEVYVESSEKRIFKDKEYVSAGAVMTSNLKDCPIIMGVKEIPVSAFEKDKTYIFFSHVIKGQPYNMPMLRKMMDKRCTLIDYERIVDENNRRLIFFGRFAGLAGMINSIWSLGQRLKLQGYTENPFAHIKQSHQYNTLEEAKQEIAKAGKAISEKGLPEELLPLTIGFTGYGNVSRGAQEIIDLLPVKEISPDKLSTLKNLNKDPNIVYKVIFEEKHISKHRFLTGKFDLQDYYDHPENYVNNFEQYIPHLTVLMNCMYWDDRYPRIFTRDFARLLFIAGKPKIMVIGDVTCDPNGSIEFTHKGTGIDDPVFVFNPLTDEPTMGFRGEGLLVMAVDILPSELAKDSSKAFGDALLDFINPIAQADFTQDFEKINLPYPVKKAMILHKGMLTPDYKYIEQYLMVES